MASRWRNVILNIYPRLDPAERYSRARTVDLAKRSIILARKENLHREREREKFRKGGRMDGSKEIRGE